MAVKTKLPLETSFAWLCGFIGTLRDGLLLLSQEKQDVNDKVDFTIPASGWAAEDASTAVADHPNYIDIPVSGLSGSDIVCVDVAPGSVTVARAADFTTTQSYAGYFRLRAKNVPTAAITAQYHITNTEPYETEG